MGTFMFIIMKRFGSVSVVILIVYYFYAIIGMELFSKYDLRDCCKNSTVEQYFATGSPNSTVRGYYFLNNFSNLGASFSKEKTAFATAELTPSLTSYALRVDGRQQLVHFDGRLRARVE